jgi:hypothetical protein
VGCVTGACFAAWDASQDLEKSVFFMTHDTPEQRQIYPAYLATLKSFESTAVIDPSLAE